MKLGWVFVWCCLSVVVTGKAQSVSFSQVPVDGQLYPRTSQSTGIIPISGRVVGLGASWLSVLVSRNGSLYQYKQVPLQYGPASTVTFSTKLAIPAELAQFRVRVFLRRTTDSVLVADRQRLVAGDAYVVNGQSNAAAYYSPPTYTFQSEYIRTFGIASSADLYNPADTLWATGNLSGQTLVGTWEMELARRLQEQYGIPICIINGAVGGAPIQLFNARNAANPMDLSTNYGRVLYRINKAGLTGSIKAYFFRQGENESSGASSTWPSKFDVLFQNVRTDYPNLGRFYLFQIHILTGSNELTGVFRDYQRKLSLLQPLIRSHATVGTITYDGIHFGVPGHMQTGQEMARIVARDFYGSTDTVQITSPNVQKVYYSSAARNELVVQFEEGQQVLWPADTTLRDTYGNLMTHQMKQWFYLDKTTGYVASGRTDGYRVTLSLTGNSTAQQLGYLPPNYPTQESGIPFPAGYAAAFPGPFLTNERGLRAFAFWNVPIGAPLSPVVGLTVSGNNNLIRLAWSDHPAEQYYVLERRREGESAFSRLIKLPANTIAYTDSSAQQSGLYRYRLRAVTTSAEATADGAITFSCQTGLLSRSIHSGTWQQRQTWECDNVPTLSSTVQIAPQQSVTVNQSGVAARISLGGNLVFRPGGTIRLAADR